MQMLAVRQTKRWLGFSDIEVSGHPVAVVVELALVRPPIEHTSQ